MNIFVELHHSGLYNSLIMLFEKRLGHKLFRPIGEEWFKEGFWKLAEPYQNNPATITQYLGIRDSYQPEDGTRPLNEIKKVDSYYTIKGDPYDQKAITLEQFKNMDIDIIIASYAPHIEPYHKLLKFHPKAKLIHQQGNEWAVDFTKVKNLLASVMPYNVPSDVNAIFYHQEFSLDTYHYGEPHENKIIRSFVNTLSTQGLFEKDWVDFLELEIYLPEYKFESYGASTRDGVINDQKVIAEKMRESRWGVHLKNMGDGFGHVAHQWFAVGRPVIFRGSQYKDRLAGLLMKDMVTGIDLDKHSITETVNIIRNISNSEYSRMSLECYKAFNSNVDYDLEEQNIKEFLSKLK